MKEIQLTQGKVALVDDADFEWLSQWNWYAMHVCKARWYAGRMEGRKTISMHQQILSQLLFGSLRGDHKNGNGLDNQRDNLRVCTQRENTRNRRAVGKSGYKGIKKNHRRWEANIQIDGKKRIYLGLYRRAIDAAVAYDEAAQRYFGEFARLNFSYDPACYI